MSIAANNQVVANVAESSIAQIHLKQEATIRADAYQGKLLGSGDSNCASVGCAAERY
jgi:multidrug resistance efflux pump